VDRDYYYIPGRREEGGRGREEEVRSGVGR